MIRSGVDGRRSRMPAKGEWYCGLMITSWVKKFER
jgi:hypothetical protein